MSDWQVVSDALDIASAISILAKCTCGGLAVVWRDDVCGHCQLEQAKQALQRLQERESRLIGLLNEALDGVEADEQARRESWPKEVESGDLVLDVGDRIRAVLREFHGATVPSARGDQSANTDVLQV